MIRAGEWSTATRAGGLGLDRNDRAGRDLPQERTATEDDQVAAGADFSLATVGRQWLTTSEAVERQARPGGDDSPLPPRWTPPMEVPPDNEGDPGPAVAHLPRQEPVALPRRRRQPPPRPARRLAVLIDAESTTAEWADELFDVLAEQGTVSVCRAYADWTSPEARGWWSSTLRQHGIQPHHHFGHDHDQRALVALTIDAVDLARESAVDAVVLVGDLVSVHPLVVRLNASGLQVLAFGTTSTPDDVKALCQEFVDLSSLGSLETPGRHRAQGGPDELTPEERRTVRG
jgi:hypothetical protein